MPAAPTRSIRDWVAWSARRMRRARLYYGHGTAGPDDEAFALVRWVLGLPHAPFPPGSRRWLRAVGRRNAARIQEMVARRIETRRPLAYLTGEAWFAGLRFRVDPRVLVPRSPIAELIAERFRPWITRDPRRILDLCAGSGCIAIACARAFPRARVDAAELDEGALEVLAGNVRLHRLGRRVRAVRSDLFGAVRGRYDLIVSNPPYVPARRLARMPREFRSEPALALAAGRDGMDLVARILRESPRRLNDGGTLVCEVGGSVPEFMRRFPGFPATWPDFEHGGDGVFVATKPELDGWCQGAGKANVG